ncbi:protein phosphatase 2C domain-containing protein [Salinisphaera sp. P385]|uniref:Protein phosphatase 2C domain-containing protein n=1 Tax=Spectribacter acetivorans TaxID=3075603 RepID=A0ABU3BCT0_9GAMM|nr:protein phosphatase 2C domain-containing protein [Salinisphaera sp. P385]MDT0618796.1 protein phosphatase 2C domain-containing protein [Salinisphaera sp. P385]
MVEIKGRTHIGKRQLNEDRFVADAGWGVALVSDGMGGPAMGEVAATIVTTGMIDRLDAGESLPDAIANTHRAVVDAAENGNGKPGMGATLVVAWFDGYDFELSWIGDSRAYLWNGELRQLTRDHSQVERLLARGKMSLTEARESHQKNIITRAMGRDQIPAADVPMLQGTLGRGQRLLLCSDGLTDMLSGPEIAAVLATEPDSDQALEILVTKAVDAGGADNITAVLATADDNGPAPDNLPLLPAVTIARDDGHSEYFPPGY